MCSIYRGGVLVSCSDDDDNGGTASVPVESVTLDKSSVAVAESGDGNTVTLVPTVKPDNATNPALRWDSNDEDIATVDQNGKVTGVAKGTATITVTSQEDSAKFATCTVNVTSAEEAEALNTLDGSYTIGTGDNAQTVTLSADGKVYDENGEVIGTVSLNDNGTVNVAIEGVETYTIGKDESGNLSTDNVTDSKGNTVTVKEEESDPETPDNPDNPVNPVTPNPETPEAPEGTPLVGWWSLDDYITDLEIPSSKTALSASTDVGAVTILVPANWTSDGSFAIEGTDMKGYVQLGVPDSGTEGTKKGLKFIAPAGTKTISVYGKNNTSLTLLPVGGTAVTKTVSDASNYAAFTWDVNIASATTYVVYNSASDGKTINIKAIYVEAVTKEAQTAPAAASFTANSAATGYSITISGADAEKATGLEYSTDGGTTWTAVTGTTITLTTYGTVKIRYAETEEKAASAAISVTVQEYKDESLDTPDAPAASKFTATGVATAGGKGSITIDSSITPTTLEYKLGTDGTVTAVTGATLSDLAAGDYYFRYKAVAGISNASEFTKVTVAAYVSPSVYTLTGASAEIVLGKTQIEAENYLAYDGSYASSSASTTTVGGNEITVERTDLKSAKSLDITVSGVKSFVVYVKSDGGADRTFDVKLDGTKVGTVICTEKVLLSGTAGGSDAKYQDVFGYTFNTNDTGAQTKISLVGGNKSVYPMYVLLKNTASEIPVESVTITGKPASNTLIKDNSVTLGATVAPDRATAKAITWSIENLENETKSAEELAKIATITDAGVLSAVGEGQVVVVATAQSGKKDSFTLNVQGSAVYATEVTLKIDDKAAGTGGEWGKGKTFTLVPTVTADGNATPTDDTVSWSSNAEGVATVSSAGVVTVVAASGTATITATANGSETAGALTATYVVKATPVYVVAGKYQLKTGTLADGYTKANSVDDAGKVGLYAVFQAVTYTSGNSSKTQSAGKFDSKGFNSTTKDVSTEGAAGTNGIITFAINKKMTLKLKDAAAIYRGFAVVATSGSNLITVGNASAVAKFSSTAGDEYTLTLESGEYKVYGNSDSGQCVIPEFIFEEVN